MIGKVLLDEINSSLKNQPSWVVDRAISNMDRFVSGNLVSKYESSVIEPLSDSDILVESDLSSTKIAEFTKIGEETLRKSEFAYFIMVGGVATSMGGCVKALLVAKDNMTFLEIKLNHIRHMQRKLSCKIPVILMTNDETDKMIFDYLESKNLLRDIDCIRIVQPVTVRFTKDPFGDYHVARDSSGKISYVPGGHYDSYLLLQSIRQDLILRGIKIIYINNIDNLGSTVDPVGLGYHVSSGSYFTPEVARKMKNEKGGVFARISGQMRLLEGPMVPDDYLSQFNDSEIHKYFNTNSIYMSVSLLDSYSEINSKVPVFVNNKDFSGIKMFGFEGAIGLIFGMKKSALIAVERSERFVPVKFLSDLWLLRSNFMALNKRTYSIRQLKVVRPTLSINPGFLSNVSDLDNKINSGGETTNFLDLVSLDWKSPSGSVGKNVKFSGAVVIDDSNCQIADGSKIGKKQSD